MQRRQAGQDHLRRRGLFPVQAARRIGKVNGIHPGIDQAEDGGEDATVVDNSAHHDPLRP